MDVKLSTAMHAVMAADIDPPLRDGLFADFCEEEAYRV
jgi:hypothetical protein